MGVAKVVSVLVRASQASHLCFEVGGILGESHIKLGERITAFDFAKFYATLGAMPTVPSHPARLLYDFLEIQAAVKKFTLVSLRAEAGKAALSKAVNGRANIYYGKYANAPAIIARMFELYSPSVTDSKPTRLGILRNLSENQMSQLQNAYIGDGRMDVVKTTQSVLDSRSQSIGKSTTTGRADQKTVSAQVKAGKFDAPPAGATSLSITATGSDPVNEAYGMDSSSELSDSSGAAQERQTIVNTDYGYRTPYLDNLAQYERSQISLIDEEFAQFMSGQNLPYLAAVFQNELSSIDSDVYRTQIAYLNTILMSPISGTVTGIYKNLGDPVRPGEPVIRVENNDAVLLMATLVYHGPIAVGSSVTVETTLFDLAGPPTSITGGVVSVRGQQEDDHWDVIVECNNLDAGGKPILPVGYHFDYDNTTVSIA
ncbi:MAG TPA: hypothetical protein VGM26_12050 [Rhizomicrobium sp.]|jgi:hypothetical protein